MKTNLIKTGLFLIVATLLLSSCADVSTVCAEPNEMVYGFWYGVWHGAIILWSLIAQLFYDDVAIYGINNNGGWYDFGYVLGVSGFLNFLVKLATIILKGLLDGLRGI